MIGFVFGDQPISDEDFTRIGQEVQQMEQTLLQTQDQLSYFEIICLMALLYFKEQAVDVVLLEDRKSTRLNSSHRL